MRQSYYKASLRDFLNDDHDRILGILNLRGTEFVSQYRDVVYSWNDSLIIFRNIVQSIVSSLKEAENWHLLLEYEIPRLGGRIDAVLLASDLIYVLEYKNDRTQYNLADIRQVEDYALDLFDFHLESFGKQIIPILIATNAESYHQNQFISSSNLIKHCLRANKNNLAQIIISAYQIYHKIDGEIIQPDKWEDSLYQPTPTIIQAAQSLFAGQKVEAITKSEADSRNLKIVTDYVISTIQKARINKTKCVCFITGVPGAGKTLVGLNIVHKKELFGGAETNTAYFSGNGPLIKVLKEALARDDYEREQRKYFLKLSEEYPKKSASKQKLDSKVQDLHLFIKSGLRSIHKTNEQIVVFDEAQRCWDANHFYNKSKRNENREKAKFEIVRKSEAEILFEIMDRHEWAVIIALVGGGQEINTGEAGIAEWGRVLASKYKKWEIHVAPQLIEGDESTAGSKLFKQYPKDQLVFTNEKLHLSVSQRSFRATHLNSWVNAVLDNQNDLANKLFKTIQENYPIYISRDLGIAKNWLRNKVIGNKRIGLLASSGAQRLRPYGINVKEDFDVSLWFLNTEADVRSSYYLELVATEFAVQGLELDWIGVCWDCDLRRQEDDWSYKNFSGTKWENINKVEDRNYLINKYRVLLTRAREGIIIWVPQGDINDPTRIPDFYDPIYKYLVSCGAQNI